LIEYFTCNFFWGGIHAIKAVVFIISSYKNKSFMYDKEYIAKGVLILSTAHPMYCIRKINHEWLGGSCGERVAGRMTG
jgi:hypothetical protein